MNKYDVFAGQLRVLRADACESEREAIEKGREHQMKKAPDTLGVWDGQGVEWRAVRLAPSRPLKPGDAVCCFYRLPSVNQWWTHPVRVGTVCEPGKDFAAWNGHNSEAEYCDLTGKLPVRYDWGGESTICHDYGCDLFPTPFGHTGEWVIQTQQEADDLHLYAAVITRNPVYVKDMVAEAVRTAFANRNGGTSPLSAFATRRMVTDEAHRKNLLRQIADLSVMSDSNPATAHTRHHRLRLIVEAAEAGEQLVDLATVFPPVLPGVPV